MTISEARRMAPQNALSRTFKFKSMTNMATRFTIDVESKQYLVTASHVLPRGEGSLVIQVYHEVAWQLI